MTLVEKMARAMEAVNANTEGLRFTKLMEAMAIAALKAMRELTPGEFPDDITQAQHFWFWTDMIDAAIKEAEGE